MIQFIKENINGILGTVIFHLLIVVLILAARLSSFDHQDEHSILVEFDMDVSEEEFREFTESLLAQNLLDYESSLTRNIAVNVSADRPVADEFKDMSPQEASELESRINEILNDAKNGIMPQPDQPEIKFEPPVIPEREKSGGTEQYSGPTTITYDLPGRTHIRVPVPVYKCPEGGIVEVNISVDQQGKVIKANIDDSPDNFNESCNHQMALEAALSSRFSQSTESPSIQTGVITFYFQKQ
jgi:hypothetical protein